MGGDVENVEVGCRAVVAYVGEFVGYLGDAGKN